MIHNMSLETAPHQPRLPRPLDILRYIKSSPCLALLNRREQLAFPITAAAGS